MDNEKFTVEFGEVTNIGGGGTSDFDELTNRPKYNDTTMSSDTNIPKVPAKTSDLTNDGSDGDSTYVEADELAKVATSGSYADLENKPSIPTVNDATLTITQNGTSKGTFTANDADDTTIEVSDTTYSNFTGTDGTTAGAAGLVPAPATTDADKFLKADGTWDTAGGGGPTVVQTTGSSTTDVMSQDATTKMIYPQSINSISIGNNNITTTSQYYTAICGNIGTTTDYGIAIGSGSSPAYLGTSSRSSGGVVIGSSATISQGYQNVAIGKNAYVNAGEGFTSTNNTAIGAQSSINGNSSSPIKNAVALGAYAEPTRSGEVNIGTGTSSTGYNSTNYRVIGGVHDPVDAHDAATKGYVDAQAGGGGGIKFLSASDFNYDDGDTGSFNTVAMWLLDDGFYFMPSNYTTVPVKGALAGTNYTRLNSNILSGSYYCFIKANNSFWIFTNMSRQDPTLKSDRPIFFCTINPANGWLTAEAGDQLAKRSELTS